MSLHDRIREARKNKGITQSDLGIAIGVAATTIAGYEKNREPTAAQLGAIADALDVDVMFLLQDEIKQRRDRTATPWEMENLIKKYRNLDDHGKEMVTLALDCETKRMDKEKATQAPAPQMKVIPLLGTSFAAGTTEQESDIPWEDLEVDADSKAEFAIHINGNSMEPYLPDGSIAYGVKRTPRDGEVAALLLDGDFICKQVCQDMAGNLYLFSLNRDRRDADQTIWHDSERSLTCFGTILMERVPLPKDV